MQSYRHLITATLILVALVTGWLYYSLQEKDGVPANTAADNQQPITVIKDFEITELDNTGRIKHRIQSRNMEQYADNHMQLLMPALDLFPQDMLSSIHLSARLGRIQENQDKIELQGAVSIIREYANNQPAMRIDTEQLQIRMNSRQANSQQMIHYHDAQIDVYATGMEIDFNTEVLRLHENVRATYQPDLITGQ